MNASSTSSSCADDKPKEQFIFEVPVINLKLETSDNNLDLKNNTGIETPAEIGNNCDNTRYISGTGIDKLNANDKLSLTVEVPKKTDRNDLTANETTKCRTANSFGEKTYVLVFDDERDNVITENVIDLDDETENSVDLIRNITDLDGAIVDLDENNTGSKRDNIITEKVIDLEDETDNAIDLNGNNTDSEDINGMCILVSDENKTDTENTVDNDINKLTEPTKLEVIDVDKETYSSHIPKLKNNRTEYNDLFKENSLLTELIEKCLDMENASGMSRVINRTLLAVYRNVGEEYKKSDAFKKVLNKTIMNLDVEPDKKFSHLKSLCDTLKMHTIKKRVPIITLKLKDNANSCASSISTKRRLDTAINLDDEVTQENLTKGTKRRKEIHPIGKVFPPIELDDDSSSDVLINDSSCDGNIILIPDDMDKENFKKKTIDSARNRPKKTCKSNKTIEQKKGESENDCTEPQTSGMNLTILKIQFLEHRIANLKQALEKLEEAEVTSDSIQSPYCVGEQVKTKILKLYKELCKLTGTEANKRHEVRLQVVPGHPEGPVRCLEKFLNANIDAKGNPPFPDMQDVVKCVKDANTLYLMNWTRSQVLNEARALFTQFGRTMQKRRQKREWRDLMSFVKREAPDPADEDPALQARLEENTRIATQNETDLIERYAKMEYKKILDDPGISMLQSDSDQNSDVDTLVNNRTSLNIDPPNNINTRECTAYNYKIVTTGQYGNTACGSNIVSQPTVMYNVDSTHVQNSLELKDKSSLLESLEDPNFIGLNNNPNENDFRKAADLAKYIVNLSQSNSTIKTDTSKNSQLNSNNKNCGAVQTLSLVKLSNLNQSLENSDVNSITDLSESFQVYTHTTKHDPIIQRESNQHDINADSIELNTPCENVNSENPTVLSDKQDKTTEVVIKTENCVVKSEPLDIHKQLEELGEGCTAIIFDIEDPFLVIEISDSSESENEEV